MNATDLFECYEAHVAAVDAEFRRVFQKFAERMQCRRGCSMCCSQMFSISSIEAAHISRAVKAMPEAERDRLRVAAIEYIERAKAMTGQGDSTSNEESITPRPGLRLPCPPCTKTPVRSTRPDRSFVENGECQYSIPANHWSFKRASSTFERGKRLTAAG